MTSAAEVAKKHAGRKPGVAVGRAAGDRFGADVAVGAEPRLDDDRLAERRRDLLRDHAHHDVELAPGRKRHHDLDRMRGPRRLRVHGQRNGGQDEQCDGKQTTDHDRVSWLMGRWERALPPQ